MQTTQGVGLLFASIGGPCAGVLTTRETESKQIEV